MVSRLTTLVSAVFLAAFASTAQAFTLGDVREFLFGNFTLEPEKFAHEFGTQLMFSGPVQTGTVALGLALFLLGIVWSGKDLVLMGSSGARPFAVRFLIAGFLLSSSAVPYGSDNDLKSFFITATRVPDTSVSTGERYEVGGLWGNAYNWGHQNFVEPAYQEAAQSGITLSLYAGTAIGGLGATYATAKTIEVAGSVFSAISEGLTVAGKVIAELSGKALELLTNGVVTVATLDFALRQFYELFVALAGGIFIIGIALLPIVAGMMVFPSGMTWVGVWSKALWSGFLMVTFIPIIFAAIYRAGYVYPLEKYTNYFGMIADGVQGITDTLGNIAETIRRGDWGEVADLVTSGELQNGAMSVVNGLVGYINPVNFIINLIGIILALVVATLLLHMISGLLTQFVGTMMSRAASAASGLGSSGGAVGRAVGSFAGVSPGATRRGANDRESNDGDGPSTSRGPGGDPTPDGQKSGTAKA